MPAPSTPLSIPVREQQSAFYALLFAGLGASLPYMPLWLKANGMTGAQIGLILALPLVLRAVSGPLIGVWVDRFSLYRTPMVVLAASGTVLYAGLSLAALAGPWRYVGFIGLWGLGYSCMTSISPLIDSMTLELSRRYSFAYTTPRAVGSAAFIVINVFTGYVLQVTTTDAILVIIVLSALMAALVGRYILLPEIAPRHLARDNAGEVAPGCEATPATILAEDKGFARVMFLLKQPKFVLLVLALGTFLGGHSFYYSFSTILWKAQGISSGMCGLLWGWGVLAEIVFFAMADRLRRFFGAWPMLVSGGVAGVIRWSLMMVSPPLWLLWPLQALHAFSFAAAFLAGLELVRQQAPKGYESLAQTLSAAYSSGFMTGVATLASGVIYDSMGGRGYGVMAAFVLTGLGISLYLWRQARTKNLTP